MTRRFSFLTLIGVICFVRTPAFSATRSPSPLSIPLTFEENRGQADSHALFIARTASGTLFLTENGIVFNLRGHDFDKSIQLHFLQASGVRPIASSPTGGFANYYTSPDKNKWLSHIPLFETVRYPEIYPGIDVVFHGRGNELEYDFEVAPGGNPRALSFDLKGMERVSIAEDGGLEIVTGDQTWRLLPPVAYQQRGNKKQPIQVRYSLLKNSTVALQIGAYDSSSLLIIDPIVESASFLPNEAGDAVASKLDAQGNFVVTGVFGSQVGIVKVNPTGTSIIYATQIGTANTRGAYPSTVASLVLDGNGNAYIAGTTEAPDFPVTSNLAACGPSCGGGFTAQFASDGSLTYSTILGSDAVVPRAITADSSGNAYVAGSTEDNSLQAVNAFQSSYTGLQCTSCLNAFYAKINPSGTAYLFSSYFYGSVAQINGEIEATAIALDSFGNILIAGMTNLDPPLVNPWQSGVGGIFLSKFAPDGKTLIFSTRFGSSQGLSESTPAGDSLTGMSIGSDGTVFLVGYTQSQDFPYQINSPQHPIVPSGYASGVSYMFATAIDPTLSKLTYSVFLGEGFLTAATIGPMNHLYVAGTSILIPFPLENQIVSDISTGGFYMELDQSGVPVTVSQFGGDFYPESPSSIAVDAVGDIYLAGLGSATITPAHFGFPGEPDPILVGPGVGSGTGGPLAIISPTNSPQLSLDTVGPFLTLRNAGSADLHISNITLSGGLAQMWGNCGSTIPATTSCILTVSDSNGLIATGSVTIVSDAQPSVQTFAVTVPTPKIIKDPIGDQLWSPGTLLVYPPQFEGTVTGSIPITIWNVGTTTATINSINTGGSLSETDNCGTQVSGGAMLAPGSSCTLQVSLTSGGSQPSLSFVYDTTRKENNYFFLATPTTQQLTLSASSVNFGTQQVNGVAIPRVVTATNTGDVALSAPSASIQGDPEFVLAGSTCTSNLASHQSCAVAVQFNPVVDGAPTATLSISGQQVTLNGQGQIGSLIQVSPLELDFPPVIIAQTSNALQLILTNVSSTVVGITGISFSLGDFTETDNCQNEVPAGGTCTMQVSFSPSQLGARGGYLTIDFSNGVLAQVITLTGSGVTPLQVSPPSLDFGSSTTVGSSSVPQSVSIGNGMQSTPQPYALTITGDFAITQNVCPNPMPGFQGCVFQISFEPKTLGPQQGALTISYPGLSGQSVVTLTGLTGSAVAPEPVFSSPSTLTFGNQALGSTLQEAVTISNTGNAILSISGFTLGGANASDFQVAAGQCSTVAPGTSCGIQVAFTPGTVGQRLATFIISDNALNSPQSIALSGSGVPPFTMQVASGSSSVTVTSGGSATYQIVVPASPGFTGVVQFVCTGAPQNATCSVQPASVNFSSSSSANIVVTVLTTGASTSLIAPGSPIFFATLAFIPVIFCFRRRLTITAQLVLMVMLLGIGCGGGSTQTPSSSTPPGTYTLTVTGSSGTQTQSIALTLVVQ